LIFLNRENEMPEKEYLSIKQLKAATNFSLDCGKLEINGSICNEHWTED